MKKFLLFIILLFVFSQCGLALNANAFLVSENCVEDTDFNSFFVGLFGEDVSKKAAKNEFVFVSGSPLGFCLKSDGVIIVAVGEVESESGLVSPCEGQDILPGDMLVSINGTRLSCAEDISNILSDYENGNSYEMAFLRNKRIIVKHVFPAIDKTNGKPRLGLWIRDSLAGIGTLTFVTDKNRFGALGHTVCDADTGVSVPVVSGDLYSCNVVGSNKGKKGEPGELKGIFVRTNEEIAGVNKNNEFGLFGDFKAKESVCLEKMKVASQNEVHPGKAYILSTVEGTAPQKYEIEIIKVNTQASQKSKSLVFRVTDGTLISKTGGIVQGMSGSPIVQDDKFVGAVTHVFVSDPTKGYGVYAEWMLEQ